MAKWYKKSLGFMSVGLITSALTSFVSACTSTSFDVLINRTWEPTVYKATYNYNVSSWNTAHSMQAEDSRIWANTFDTFLSSDQYGRIYGSLAISEYGREISKNPKYTHVGFEENNSTKWTYALREMNWVNYQGNVAEKDKNASVLEGVKRSAWYALDPVKGSDVSSLWTSFIKGAAEIRQNLLKANKDKNDNKISEEKYKEIYEKEKAKIFNNSDKNFGVYAGQDWNGYKTIVFDLAKPAPYFESLLNYSVFSPIDDLKNATTKFQDTKYNGAYYVEEAHANGKIILKKNQHHPLKESVSIERLEFDYQTEISPAKERILFESGSTTGFEIKADDLKGWSSYIGAGKEFYDRPKFGNAYPIFSTETPGTHLLIYNYYNINMDNPIVSHDDREKALNGSKLLQSKDVRAFISTSLNRSDIARFYSKTIDELNKPSSVLRNTYTGPCVAKDDNGVDYTQYVASMYESKGQTTTFPDKDNKNDIISDGKDAYLNKSQELVNKTQDQLINDINQFIELNNIKKSKVKGQKNNKNRVVLKLLLSPANNTSLNPYANMMVKAFNSIKNNPIYIETKTMASVDEYRTEGIKGATDLYMTGWLPDYRDPSSFLETLMLNGSYSSYNGTHRLFKNGKYEAIPEQLQTKSIDNRDVNDSETKALYKAFEDYSKEFLNIDETKINLQERYLGFAKQEYNFFYQDFLALTLFTRGIPKVWNITYISPYSKSYEAFGTSKFKFYNTTLETKLLSREQYIEAKQKYDKEKEEVEKDWTKLRDKGAHWKEVPKK